ncbi:MAG: o-succinylbenzoate synthase, partial [Bacteroidales bacterium]|jgi:O-succinylbenzoate synthase|nr:o-succinylbenzoate synthase [Bacteroidales bacterium]
MDIHVSIPDYPALQFGFETAALDLNSGGERILFPSEFTIGLRGIPINGLIWMGSKANMLEQVRSKIQQGFSILKLKVGAIKFREEEELLLAIRKEYKADDLEIRLDANGAWGYDEALEKLARLDYYNIHSIEQPIAAGHIEEMSSICKTSPIPIALDEELIGVKGKVAKQNILTKILPQYIILKPSLLGGLASTSEWIELAENAGIAWWVTSALESNIGLNAITQWAATLNTKIAQGLGTGSLFSNNIPSPLEVKKDRIFYVPGKKWNISSLIP